MRDEVKTDRSHHPSTRRPTRVERLMRHSANQVFREPEHVGERVVIPATVAYGAGRGEARRIAVVEAGPRGVRVRPVIDMTKVGLAVVAAAVTAWRVTRTMRAPRASRLRRG